MRYAALQKNIDNAVKDVFVALQKNPSAFKRIQGLFCLCILTPHNANVEKVNK
jgi:hypothetical protein